MLVVQFSISIVLDVLPEILMLLVLRDFDEPSSHYAYQVIFYRVKRDQIKPNFLAFLGTLVHISLQKIMGLMIKVCFDMQSSLSDKEKKPISQQELLSSRKVLVLENP